MGVPATSGETTDARTTALVFDVSEAFSEMMDAMVMGLTSPNDLVPSMRKLYSL